ncbi:MAG: hypothetical protein ABR585_04165 [Gemmatimonadaceae bacterium]
MAAAPKKATEDEGGEFADFMADISNEIAQRVESLETPAKGRPAEMKKEQAAPDPGVITEWDDVADRMIEEMR